MSEDYHGWRAFERHVTEVLGLDATITSGNKFFDPGDGVTRGRGHAFPLFADAKYTEHFSHALQLKTLSDLSERATEQGKRMIMPLRFWPKGTVHPEDYVVLSLHDFAEMRESAEHHMPRNGDLWCPVHRGWHPSPVCDPEES